MVQSIRLINQKNTKNLLESIYEGQKLEEKINQFNKYVETLDIKLAGIDISNMQAEVKHLETFFGF
ncbi:hypothetical protein HC766_03320 [Candidatus Gracilibacteria bacterium]|nr:hypothetical protein [Candidatus Gracilibacteria bacterium]